MTLDIRYFIGDAKLDDLVDEFRRNPTGQHSASLQRLINRIRSEPMEGKLALLCTKPHEEWILIQMNGRKKPITVIGDKFNDINDAEWAVFRRRIKRHFGIDLPEPR
ncbi:MAG: ABC transporter permease [Hyphomicrobiales bacterium]|nr:ABC transporter permease [Hyphomicrobiales bacterium]